MSRFEFLGKKSWIVLGVLMVSLLSFAIGAKDVNAIETQTNISTRNTQTATSGRCYTTGYNNSGCTNGTSSIDEKDVLTGSIYNMTFSHNFKTDNEDVSVDCEVSISTPDIDGYILSNAGSASYSYGLTSPSRSADCDATTGTGGSVPDSVRPYSDGKHKYIHRDFLEVEFTEAGTYTFCETIVASANGYSDSTTGCITYTVKDPPKYDLNVVPRLQDGTVLGNSSTAGSGNEGNQICTGTNKGGKFYSSFNKDDYEFVGYSESDEGGATQTSQLCVTIGNKDRTVYAVYKKKLAFNGKSSVYSGNNSETTGFVNTTKSVSLKINNCSAVSGCKVKFTHALELASGSGSTSYKIARTSNLFKDGSPRSIINDSKLKIGNFSGTTETVYTSDELTLYPGMVVCEAIYFYKGGGSETDYDTVVTACASALGKAQPTDPEDPYDPSNPEYDPNGDDTSEALIDIEVKNNNNDKYNTYRRYIYAKPGDKVTYRATYNPILQYVYYLFPDKLSVNNGNAWMNSDKQYSVGEIFNNKMNPDWNNAFMVGYGNEKISNVYSFNPGLVDKQIKAFPNDGLKIEDGDVGSDLRETAIINNDKRSETFENGFTTPSQVEFKDSSGSNTGNVITSSIMRTAHVYVPYNFKNTIKVTTPEGIVYAGESKTIEFKIEINGKKNSLTSPDVEYATHVDGMKYRARCLDENCSIGDDKTGLGSSYKIDIPDLKAGKRICVIAEVYPATSGADGNWNDPEGDHKWAESETVCFTVAKRPNLQIWGGNVFTNGQISLTEAKKTHLAGGDDNKTHVFGSWAELGLVAKGEVTGLASGVGFGYDEGWSGFSYNYCEASTLSFANVNCKDSVGDLENSSSVKEDKSGLIERFRPENYIDYFVDEVVWGDETQKVSDTDRYYYYNDDRDLTIAGAEIEKETTHVIETTKDVIISGNIIYEDGYNSIKEVPKLFIYAKNIYIDCAVTRIDAVLIAEEVVLTCNDLGEKVVVGDDGVERTKTLSERAKDKINEKINSTQLIINGTIITDKLIANRTYGAATGTNSIVPAEIINYDSTLYLWGQDRIRAANVWKLETVYQHELAPRY